MSSILYVKKVLLMIVTYRFSPQRYDFFCTYANKKRKIARFERFFLFFQFTMYNSQFTIRVQFGAITHLSRFNYDIAPKDTHNIPKGYPKDTDLILVKWRFILYILRIYTFYIAGTCTPNYYFLPKIYYSIAFILLLYLIYTSFFIKIVSFSFFSCIYAKKVVPL